VGKVLITTFENVNPKSIDPLLKFKDLGRKSTKNPT
jgi:hypothetical protein